MDVVSLLILVLIVVTIVVVGIVGILLLRKFNSMQIDPSAMEAAMTKSLAGNTNLVKTAVEAGLASSQDTLKGSFAVALKDLKVDESIGQIYKVGQDLANSTSSLIKMLEVGQSRGTFGETQMERLLRDSIASAYIHFKESITGLGTPDAYVDSPYGKVCIDSKFPIENYRKFVYEQDEAARKRVASTFRRDVKNHLDTVAKYVRPELKTASIALAFIPSESVYAYLAEHENELIEESSQSGVLVSSPSTLLTNLALITAANRAVEVTRRAQDIQQRLTSLRKNINDCYEDWSVLQKHLYNAYWKREDVEHSFDILKNEFDKTSGKIEKGGEDS